MHKRILYPVYLLALVAFIFTGCDNGSLTATESLDSDKPDVALDFSEQPSADDVRKEDSKAFGTIQQDGDKIKDQYIVVFKEGMVSGRASVNSMAASMVQANGGEVLQTYGTAIQGFAARLPEEALKGLRNNPNVDYIEEDRTVYALDTQNNATWGLDRSDQRDRPLSGSYTYNYDGSGVTAYIIDTGIRTTHSQFGGRASQGYDAFGGNSEDCHGHGTHVAGTVGSSTYGIAKNVDLVAVRVLNCSGSGSNSGVIAGVDWVAQNASGPSVANMSLGGGASTALDNAIRNAINSGVSFAVAAGNENQNACNVSPARVDEALTVGSTTSSDVRSSFSNYGTCVDIFAPGSSITSTWYTSNSATNTISGTSMASPHVAGAAALYLDENPSASPATVFSALRNNASSGKLSSINSGSPNLLLYTLTGSGPDPDPDPDPAPCSNCTLYTGSLSGTGDYDYQPNGTYYYSGSGTHNGYLRGPSNADFDLDLYKWNGRSWSRVATSQSANSDEDIAYSSSAGYFLWRVRSYSGSGSYDFYLDRP